MGECNVDVNVDVGLMCRRKSVLRSRNSKI